MKTEKKEVKEKRQNKGLQRKENMSKHAVNKPNKEDIVQ